MSCVFPGDMARFASTLPVWCYRTRLALGDDIPIINPPEPFLVIHVEVASPNYQPYACILVGGRPLWVAVNNIARVG